MIMEITKKKKKLKVKIILRNKVIPTKTKMSSKAEILYRYQDGTNSKAELLCRNLAGISLAHDKEEKLLILGFTFSEENTQVLQFSYGEKLGKNKEKYPFQLACRFYALIRKKKSKHDSLLETYNFCKKMCDSLLRQNLSVTINNFHIYY